MSTFSEIYKLAIETFLKLYPLKETSPEEAHEHFEKWCQETPLSELMDYLYRNHKVE